MKIHIRSQIKVRCRRATPKFRDPQADAKFDEHARQDVLALLEEVEKLEKELARRVGRGGCRGHNFKEIHE